VILRRKQQTLSGMNALLSGLSNGENGNALQESFDAFRKSLFPGLKTEKETFLEEAKRQLADASKSVFVIKPQQGVDRVRTMQKARMSSNAALRSWAKEEHQRENLGLQRLRANRTHKESRPRGKPVVLERR